MPDDYRGLDHHRGDDHSWIQTFTGGLIWPLDPHPHDIRIEDIAHGLALNCRYGGQCKFHYSPAQHSVYVARVVQMRGYNRQTIRTALLHDGSEGYITDLVRPVKHRLSQYLELEQKFEIAVAEKFDLIFPYPPCIKQADNDLLMTERETIMATPPRPWSSSGRVISDIEIIEMSWQGAEKMFLDFYETVK